MPQAVWTGHINFGLVSIPVRLFPATEPKDVRFHLYDRETGRRVRYERVVREIETPTFTPPPPEVFEDEITNVPSGPVGRTELPSIEASPDAWPSDHRIEASSIVRGIELPTGDFVTVEDEELESLTPERSRTIDIEEFVNIGEIDPVFFEKSYYVAPAWRSGGEKPYVLLLRAMQAAGMVGIGRFVLRTKPHLVAIRPLDRILGLETLYFGDEVRKPEDVASVPAAVVSEREIKTAQDLIGALATEWVPEKHADTYREELLEMLRSKAPATRPEDGAAAATATPVDDLMAVLRASVEAAKRRASEAPRQRPKKTG